MATTSSRLHCDDFQTQWPDLTTTVRSSRFESLIDLMWRQLVGQSPTTFSVPSRSTQAPLGQECQKNFALWELPLRLERIGRDDEGSVPPEWLGVKRGCVPPDPLPFVVHGRTWWRGWGRTGRVGPEH